ncbi:hypothetical protein PG984_002989 [Apiospora sp. TS-2023a]
MEKAEKAYKRALKVHQKRAAATLKEIALAVCKQTEEEKKFAAEIAAFALPASPSLGTTAMRPSRAENRSSGKDASNPRATVRLQRRSLRG